MIVGIVVGAVVTANLAMPPSVAASAPVMFGREQVASDIPDEFVVTALTALAQVRADSIRAVALDPSAGSTRAFVALDQDGQVCGLLLQGPEPLAYSCLSVEQFDLGGIILYAPDAEASAGLTSASRSIVGIRIDPDGQARATRSTYAAPITSTVDPSSTPGFIAVPQAPEDRITEIDPITLGVAPDSTRFQGTWLGRSVFLGLAASLATRVEIITGIPGDPNSWGTYTTDGNTVIGAGVSDQATLYYLPQGSDEAPPGWRALGAYTIVREGT